MVLYYVEVYCEEVYYVEKYYLMYMGVVVDYVGLDSKVDRVIYYVGWVEMYQYYSLVRGTMVEATLLWASVERDMLDKKMMMKFFPWWSVAHCARSKSASVGLGCNNFCSL